MSLAEGGGYFDPFGLDHLIDRLSGNTCLLSEI